MAIATNPVLIGGTDRSGPGLLGELLERHASLAISRRTNLWTFYLNRYGDLSNRENLDRCLDAMFAYTRIRAMQPDRARLTAEFTEGDDHSYFRLFLLLGQQYAKSVGKPRWGDKSLNSERDAARILEAYPDAVMIHVIRDPRDRHASMVHHRGGRRGGVLGSTAVWLHSARLAARNAERFRGRYLVVRYEDLVADPDSKLHEICRFLGEPFDPHMLTVAPEDAGGTKARFEFTNTSIGRFEVDVPGREIALMERLLGPEMERLGYQRSREKSLRWGERLRLELLDRPAATALLVFWLPWSTFRRRFWSGPSSRRTVPVG
jgi:hypothetical protein